MISQKDLRLPHLEFLPACRPIILEVDYQFSSNVLDFYTIEVALNCPDIGYSVRKPQA